MRHGIRPALFVTGATGLIGAHFVRQALERKWRLRCLIRHAAPFANPGIRWVRGDLRKNGRWMSQLKGCDAVVHLAVLPLPECEKNPLQGCETIVGGLKRLLDAATRADVRRAMIGSSAEVYGLPRRFSITEKTPVRPLSIYGLLKAAADLLALRHGARTGTSVCVLRFFNVYGRKTDGSAPNNVAHLFADQILRDETIALHGSARNSRDFLHVRDAVRALLLAVERPKAEGVFNVSSGRETTLLRIAQRLAVLSGRKLRAQVRPSKGRFRRMRGDSGRARRILGFRPKVPLDEGLREVLNLAKDI